MSNASKPAEPSAVLALRMMEEALSLLDAAEVGAEVGAHLDLAIHRLRELLSLDESSIAKPV